MNAPSHTARGKTPQSADAASPGPAATPVQGGSATSTAEGLVLAGLITLCLVPAVAGVARLVQLYVGGAVTPENARFFASPWPVVLHIVGSLAFGVGGALQLLPSLRQSRPALHRRLGRMLVAFGMLSALSGLWMTQFYPPATMNFDGPALQVIRLCVGFGMVLTLWLGYRAAVQRRLAQHRRWMLRAYALALGAGTQVLTHLPWLLFPAWHGETLRALCMAAGWLINLGVAEWVIARHPGVGRRPVQAR